MSRLVAKSGIQKIQPHMTALPPGFSSQTIKLSSNESPFGPSPAVKKAALNAATHMERYAEQGTGDLQQAIGETFGLDPERIVCGPGSDELLSRLCRAYLGAGDELIFSANGYAKFGNYALANDAIPIKAPDQDFTVSVDSILKLVTDNTRVITIANPDNPTGTCVSGADIRRLHSNLPENILLVLDSAYLEYVDSSDFENPAALVDQFDNVVMTRTFSKIYGLAGLRLGWLYGSADVVDVMKRIATTFPISNIALDCGIAAVNDTAYCHSIFSKNRSLKTALEERATHFGLNFIPSQTNFMLLEFSDSAHSAEAAAEALWQQGIMVRRFPSPAMNNYIRVSMGNQQEMVKFYSTLQSFLQH